MKSIIAWIEDQVLSFITKRCPHPGRMVAADIIEGTWEYGAVKYCRRCGAVKVDWVPGHANGKVAAIEHFWRRPDPNLWR